MIAQSVGILNELLRPRRGKDMVVYRRVIESAVSLRFIRCRYGTPGYELQEHRLVCVSAVERTNVLTSEFVRNPIGESTDPSDGEKVEHVQLALAS
jgi:hypothetical protein